VSDFLCGWIDPGGGWDRWRFWRESFEAVRMSGEGRHQGRMLSTGTVKNSGVANATTALCSARVTRLHRSYRRLRLPIIPASSLAVYACREVRTSCAPMSGSPWLPHAQLVRLVADLDPGVACVACRCAIQVVACWGHETIGTHLRGYFRTQSFKDSLTCYPLRLASFRTYASNIASP
jgi:hypothetical protein